MYQVVVLKVISDIRSATRKIVAKRKIEILEKTRKSNAEIDYCQQGKNCQKLKNCNILYRVASHSLVCFRICAKPFLPTAKSGIVGHCIL